VIGPSGTVRVMVATKPVDFRKGMEGLAMLVRSRRLHFGYRGLSWGGNLGQQGWR
jgi:hypothetical protein